MDDDVVALAVKHELRLAGPPRLREVGVQQPAGRRQWRVRVRGDVGQYQVPEAPGASPIVVVGDANALAWHANGYPSGYKGSPRAGISDQLAALVGGPVELKATDATGWRNASAAVNPGTGAAKAIVWCFSAVDFLRDPSAPVRPAAESGTAGGRSTPRPRRESQPSPSGGGLNLIEPDVNLR